MEPPDCRWPAAGTQVVEDEQLPEQTGGPAGEDVLEVSIEERETGPS